MNNSSRDDASMVFSYLQLRKIIGLLGIALPFVLALGAVVFFATGLQDSISSYYHTGMQDVFVGILCVIGFFLLSYKGYELSDNIAGDIACICAIGTALLPTAQEEKFTAATELSGYLHLGFATLFFLTLIYFSLFLFTKTDPNGTPTPRKLQRNLVYRVCGYTMAACIALIAIYYLMPDSSAERFEDLQPVFWLEALAIVVFGVSWLTKGEGILRDAD